MNRAITADQVRDTEWATISHTDFERGGWGYIWESVSFPGLVRKIWRRTRHDVTRQSMFVGRECLGVYLLDASEPFPPEVYAHAAHLLNANRSEEQAA